MLRLPFRNRVVVVVGGVEGVEKQRTSRSHVVERPWIVHSESKGCSLALLFSYGALQPFDGGLKCRVLLDAALGDGRRVDDRRVVAGEQLTDVRERGLQ